MTEEDHIKKIDSFKELTKGWDSYDAKPIAMSAIDKAKRLNHSLCVNYGAENIFYVPTHAGGIQIEIDIA